jgi:hypothetical protein
MGMSKLRKGILIVLGWVAAMAFLLWADYSCGAQTMGPIQTPQVDTIYYVNQVPGFYTTIQASVTKACSTVGAVIALLPGSAPADTPTAVTGGCTSTGIIDERQTPWQTYGWNGAHYVNVSSSVSVPPNLSALASNSSGSIIAATNVPFLNAASNTFTGNLIVTGNLDAGTISTTRNAGITQVTSVANMPLKIIGANVVNTALGLYNTSPGGIGWNIASVGSTPAPGAPTPTGDLGISWNAVTGGVSVDIFHTSRTAAAFLIPLATTDLTVSATNNAAMHFGVWNIQQVGSGGGAGGCITAGQVAFFDLSGHNPICLSGNLASFLQFKVQTSVTNGAGMQVATGAACAAAAGGQCGPVTITLPVAEPDALYQVICNVQNVSNPLTAVDPGTFTTTSFQVFGFNLGTATSSGGTFVCMVIHS